jgi:hypothetical protein
MPHGVASPTTPLEKPTPSFGLETDAIQRDQAILDGTPRLLQNAQLAAAKNATTTLARGHLLTRFPISGTAPRSHRGRAPAGTISGWVPPSGLWAAEQPNHGHGLGQQAAMDAMAQAFSRETSAMSPRGASKMKPLEARIERQQALERQQHAALERANQSPKERMFIPNTRRSW